MRWLLALFLVLLVSCGSDNTEPEPTNVGTEGLSISFQPNYPPARIYANSEFSLALELANNGAYPKDHGVVDGKVAITGYDPSVITLSETSPIELPDTLYGKSLSYPVGGRDRITLTGTAAELAPQLDELSQMFLATLCYRYQTNSEIPICFDSTPFETQIRDKPCTIPPKYSLSGGQGAPVAVTQVEQEVVGNTAYFRVYIKNEGEGVPMARGRGDVSALVGCIERDPDFEDIDQVYVYAADLISEELECSPRIIKLINNEGLTVCKMTLPEDKMTYTTSLFIGLEYIYQESASTKMTIVRTP